jgi:hypothetical protein
MTYQAKKRFQNVPFKRNLQRYTAAYKGCVFTTSKGACTLTTLKAGSIK